MISVHRKAMFIKTLLWIGIAVFYFYVFPFISGLIFSAFRLDVNKWKECNFALGAVIMSVCIILINRKTDAQNSLQFKPFQFSVWIKAFALLTAAAFFGIIITDYLSSFKHHYIYSQIRISVSRTIHQLMGKESLTIASFFSDSIRYTAKDFFRFGFLPTVILLPIFDELFFRAVIYRDVKKYFKIKTAVFISSLLFGITAFFYPAFTNTDISGKITVFIFTALYGMVFALLYEKTNSILASILLHIMFNAAVTCLNSLTLINGEIICILIAAVIMILKNDKNKSHRNEQQIYDSIIVWLAIIIVQFCIFSSILDISLYEIGFNPDKRIFFYAINSILLTVFILFIKRKRGDKTFLTLKPVHFFTVLKFFIFSMASTVMVKIIYRLVFETNMNSAVASLYQLIEKNNFASIAFFNTGLQVNTLDYILFTIIPIGIVLPIFEEVFMRGLIYNDIKKLFDVKTAIIVSALVFGFGHIAFMGHENPTVYDRALWVVDTAIFGILWAIAYEKSRTLLVPILLHVMYNTILETLSFRTWGILALLCTVAALIILIIDFIKFIKRRKTFNEVHANPISDV